SPFRRRRRPTRRWGRKGKLKFARSDLRGADEAADAGRRQLYSFLGEFCYCRQVRTADARPSRSKVPGPAARARRISYKRPSVRFGSAGKYLAEGHPPFAVELDELHVLQRIVVVRSGIDENPLRRHVERHVLQVRGGLHD